MPYAVEDLFQTLCDCAALNPDPGDGGIALSLIWEHPVETPHVAYFGV